MTKDELEEKVKKADGFLTVRAILDRLEFLGLLTFDKPLPPLPVVKRGDKVGVVLGFPYEDNKTFVATLVDLEKL